MFNTTISHRIKRTQTNHKSLANNNIQSHNDEVSTAAREQIYFGLSRFWHFDKVQT